MQQMELGACHFAAERTSVAPQQSGHRMEVRIGSIESARRALSYLREHCRNELSAFDADLVTADVEVGQWGADQIKTNRNAEKRG